MVFFLFSFSDPVKSFKTNSGPILRQANVLEREKVVGRRSLSARESAAPSQTDLGDGGTRL